MQLLADKKIGANTFAYPKGYSKVVGYAKNSACTHCLRQQPVAAADVVVLDVEKTVIGVVSVVFVFVFV